jgi:hypothetical protein
MKNRSDAGEKRSAAKRRANAGKGQGLSSRLAAVMPKALTGSADEMERRLKAAFGNKDFRGRIEEVRRKNAAYWLICTGLLLLLVTAVVSQLLQGGDPVVSVIRPSYTAAPLRVAAVAEAEYGNVSVKRNVELTVRPKSLSDEEKTARIKETARRLPDLILGQNESLSSVSSDLNLIASDAETGVAVSWASENPALISDKGEMNGVVGRAGDALSLKARLSLENISETVEINGVLGVLVSEDGLTGDVTDVLSETVAALNVSADGDVMTLPASDANGVLYRWRADVSDFHIPEISALALFMLFLRHSRYSWIDKRVKAARRSIIKDFPEFIDKLLLMLNAGLVVSEALSRIAADYELRRDAGKPRQLYEELVTIRRRVEHTNAPLSAELNMMAARSGVRELMRFASVVSDNIGKGSALAEKLKAEGELVWKLRKKDAEEAGRLSETKMILPMTLTLLTLVMITMAPAVLDMS